MHPARLQALIVESVVAAVVVIVISVCAMASSSQHCRHHRYLYHPDHHQASVTTKLRLMRVMGGIAMTAGAWVH